MPKTSFLVVFIAIVVADLIGGSIDSLSWLHFIAKPLIVLSLIYYFLKESSHLELVTKKLTIVALAVSLLGDVLLLFVDKSAGFFTSGLVAFLVAHIMYTLLFLKRRNTAIKPIAFVAFLTFYGLCLFYFMKDGLNEMLVPVVIYMLVIIIMASTAYLRKDVVSKRSYQWVIIGALFFMLSDSILAMNKFNEPIAYAHVLIMATYAAAQFCIVHGILFQKK